MCASSWKQTLAPNVKWPSFLCAESTPNPSGCPLRGPHSLEPYLHPRARRAAREQRGRGIPSVSAPLCAAIFQSQTSNLSAGLSMRFINFESQIPVTVQMYRPGSLPLNALRRNISETDLRVAPTGAPTNTLDRRPCNPTRLLQGVDYIHQS